MADFIQGNQPIHDLPLPLEMANFSTKEQQQTWFAQQERTLGVPVRRPWETPDAFAERCAKWSPPPPEEGITMSPHVANTEWLRLERGLANMPPGPERVRLVRQLNEYARVCGRPVVSLDEVDSAQAKQVEAQTAYETFASIPDWKDRLAEVKTTQDRALCNHIAAMDPHEKVRRAALARIVALESVSE